MGKRLEKLLSSLGSQIEAARMFSTTAQLDFLIELKADAIKKLDKIKSAKRV